MSFRTDFMFIEIPPTSIVKLVEKNENPYSKKKE